MGGLQGLGGGGWDGGRVSVGSRGGPGSAWAGPDPPPPPLAPPQRTLRLAWGAAARRSLHGTAAARAPPLIPIVVEQTVSRGGTQTSPQSPVPPNVSCRPPHGPR